MRDEDVGLRWRLCLQRGVEHLILSQFAIEIGTAREMSVENRSLRRVCRSG